MNIYIRARRARTQEAKVLGAVSQCLPEGAPAICAFIRTKRAAACIYAWLAPRRECRHKREVKTMLVVLITASSHPTLPLSPFRYPLARTLCTTALLTVSRFLSSFSLFLAWTFLVCSFFFCFAATLYNI